MPEDDVIKMNRRLSSRDFSLNAPLSIEEEGAEFQDTLVDAAPDPERRFAAAEELGHHSAMLRKAMQALPERERHILTERRLNEDRVTLEDLGKVHGISRERVRQLEVRAFDKVQKAVREAAETEADL